MYHTYQYMKNFESLDISFNAWLKESNNITAHDVKKAYKLLLSEMELKLEKTPSQNKNAKKEIKSDINELKQLKKQKLKELKEADKKILAFKKFRSTYKICNDAIDLANTEVNTEKNIKEINKEFLDIYKDILGKKERNPKELENYDFTKKTKELINKTKKVLTENRKTKKVKNYIKQGEIWYRKLIGFLGTANKLKARDSSSGKFLLTGENDLSNWMQNTLKNDQKISDIVIPASHDAGSYSMKPISFSDVFGKTAQTQTVNFKGQLKAGIRYFDLRMSLENGIPVMSHGIVKGAPVSEALRQIKKFAKSHPKEIIIIEISHTSQECLNKFCQLPSYKELSKLNYIEDIQNPGKIGSISVSKIYNSEKNILMFKANNNAIIDIFDEPIRQSRNTEKMVINELKILIDNIKNGNKNNHFHKITPTHCATASDILSKGSYWKPMWYAVKKCKNDFNILLKDENFKKFANVVSYDGALENAWFAKKLIEINEKIRSKTNEEDSI